MPKGKHMTLKINYLVYQKIYSDPCCQPVEKLEILGALLLVYAYTRELNQALVVLFQARRNHGYRGIMYLFPDFGVIQKFWFWFANICRCDLLYRINLDQFFFHCSSSRYSHAAFLLRWHYQILLMFEKRQILKKNSCGIWNLLKLIPKDTQEQN